MSQLLCLSVYQPGHQRSARGLTRLHTPTKLWLNDDCHLLCSIPAARLIIHNSQAGCAVLPGESNSSLECCKTPKSPPLVSGNPHFSGSPLRSSKITRVNSSNAKLFTWAQTIIYLDVWKKADCFVRTSLGASTKHYLSLIIFSQFGIQSAIIQGEE